MIDVVTGHRPEKIIAGLRQEQSHVPVLEPTLTWYAEDVLRSMNVQAVITGMAEGWDLAVAEAALKLGIPYIAAVPFIGQERLWSGRSQERYRHLLDKAERMEVISPHSLNIAYQRRDEWMVDEGQKAKGRLIALYAGFAGGTRNTMDYAHDWMMPVENVWEGWVEVCRRQR